MLKVLFLNLTTLYKLMKALYLGIKQKDSEDDHLSGRSAKVTNSWSYTSNPQCFFMAQA